MYLTDEEEYAALGLTAADEQDTWDQKKKLLEKQSENGKLTRFDKFRNRFLRFLDRLFPYQKTAVILYTVAHLRIAGCALHANRPGCVA